MNPTTLCGWEQQTRRATLRIRALQRYNPDTQQEHGQLKCRPIAVVTTEAIAVVTTVLGSAASIPCKDAKNTSVSSTPAANAADAALPEG